MANRSEVRSGREAARKKLGEVPTPAERGAAVGEFQDWLFCQLDTPEIHQQLFNSFKGPSFNVVGNYDLSIGRYKLSLTNRITGNWQCSNGQEGACRTIQLAIRPVTPTTNQQDYVSLFTTCTYEGDASKGTIGKYVDGKFATSLTETSGDRPTGDIGRDIAVAKQILSRAFSS